MAEAARNLEDVERAAKVGALIEQANASRRSGGDRAAELEIYEQAIALDPLCIEAQRERVILLGSLRRFDEAAAAAARAAMLRHDNNLPESGEIYFALSLVMKDARRYSEARIAANRALKLGGLNDIQVSLLSGHILTEDDNALSENISPDYTKDSLSPEAPVTRALPMGETETIDSFAARKGLTLTELEKAANAWSAAKADSTTPAPAAAAPVWPSEKWEASPERGSRKQHAIFVFLRRVWKPFIEETGAVVTRRILAEVDGPAAAAVKSALRSSPMPDDIRIVATKDLKNQTATRPRMFSSPPRSSIPDIR